MTDAYDTDTMAAYLDELRSTPFVATDAAFGMHAGRTPADLLGTSIDQLSRPCAVVRAAELDHNIARLARYCDGAGIRLAPHVKTTMSPEIIARQLRAGAWAATVANADQARVAHAAGARRILVANELVDPIELADVHRLASTGTRIITYVDSIRGLELLAGHRSDDSTIDVLVELGAPGGRTGCRSIDEVTSLASAVAREPSVVFRGVAGFEGVLAGDRSTDSLEKVARYCRALVDAAEACRPLLGDEPIVVSAGGSVFFDQVAHLLNGDESHPRQVVVRSGAYLVHDHGYLGEVSPLNHDHDPFRHALEVRARVISRPESTLAIVGAGKRDLGNDLAAPTPLRVRGGTGVWHPIDGLDVTSLNDQHAFVRSRDGGDLPDAIEVGAELALGTAHPCTTFDRWRLLAVVDDADLIVEVAHTYF